jgi:hypothetical protein
VLFVQATAIYAFINMKISICAVLEASATSGTMSAALNDTFTSIVMGSSTVKKKGIN